jgi:tape measure domain-containing protein
MATKSVSIRLSLQDGETVRRALLQLGEDGQKALLRIETAAQPASKSLLAMNAASQDIQGGMAGFASRLGPIGSVMMALGPAGLAAGAAIGFFGKAMVESTIKVESLEARLKGLVGAAALTETTSYLYAQAQKTGTALETVVGAYSRLAALQKAGIITTGESRALLEGFQSTAIALGASSEQLEQSLFGLAQGLSSGTLRAEELNQIVEPMPGLLQALDRAAALPSGGFRQMVTQGKVTADFFRDTLIKALRGFDEAAKESADTAERSFTRMANAWQGFTNAPWLRKVLSGGANAGAATLESLTPGESTVKSRLADLDRRIAALGGEQALDKPLPAGTHSVVVMAVREENEELRRLLAERQDVAADLDEITRKRAGMEAQAKMERDRVRAEQREPTYIEKLSDLKFEVEWQEKLNTARAAGNAEFSRTKAQYEAAKGFRQIEKELFQQGGVYRTQPKEQEIKDLLAREAEAKGAGEMSAQAQAEVLGLNLQARGQERLAEAARTGGQAQIDAARAAKVLEFAFKNNGAAVAEYGLSKASIGSRHDRLHRHRHQSVRTGGQPLGSCGGSRDYGGRPVAGLRNRRGLLVRWPGNPDRRHDGAGRHLCRPGHRGRRGRHRHSLAPGRRRRWWGRQEPHADRADHRGDGGRHLSGPHGGGSHARHAQARLWRHRTGRSVAGEDHSRADRPGGTRALSGDIARQTP